MLFEGMAPLPMATGGLGKRVAFGFGLLSVRVGDHSRHPVSASRSSAPKSALEGAGGRAPLLATGNQGSHSVGTRDVFQRLALREARVARLRAHMVFDVMLPLPHSNVDKWCVSVGGPLSRWSGLPSPCCIFPRRVLFRLLVRRVSCKICHYWFMRQGHTYQDELFEASTHSELQVNFCDTSEAPP